MKNAKSPQEKDKKGAGTLAILKAGQACQPTRSSPWCYVLGSLGPCKGNGQSLQSSLVSN